MSLIASASVWTNDDPSNTTNKKRIPTMRKPSRKPTTIPEDDGGTGWKSNSKISSEDLFISDDSVYQENTAIQNSQDMQAERNARVNQLLNQLTDSNDGNKLADFQPITPPTIQPTRSNLMQTVPSNPLQIPPPNVVQRSSPFIPISPDLGNISGNYKNMYDPEIMQGIQSGRSGPSGQMQQPNRPTASSQPLDSKLMDKINYMIHMLEQQQNEKTSNITEEFILYTFLGVFIIFIVDSFARSGRYTR